MKKEKIERVKIGIPGVDEILNGGVPDNNLVLLTGSTGTGKTTFGLQYLVEGAKQGESGVYITLEEEAERLKRDGSIFGWNIEELEEKNRMTIIRPDLYKYNLLLSDIQDSVERINAKRLVLDSVSFLGSYFKDRFELRRNILELSKILKRLDCTSLVISEIEEGSNKLSRFGVEEFSSDGIILLYYLQQRNLFVRAISVRKMRSSSHSQKIYPMEISENGIIVYPDEEVF